MAPEQSLFEPKTNDSLSFSLMQLSIYSKSIFEDS